MRAILLASVFLAAFLAAPHAASSGPADADFTHGLLTALPNPLAPPPGPLAAPQVAPAIAPTAPPSPEADFSSIASQLQVPQGIRLIVFSPHPDDESLSSAGIIQEVVGKGGQVRVVFITNGDGYREGVRQKVKAGHRICSKDFVDYGKCRQDEAAQAMCILGLKTEDVVFLSFPDDGIDDLWEEYWSNLKPFISPYTLFDRPYRVGMKRWVKYSGVDLKEEIARNLEEFSPDWVILPDPRDLHPDHSTTGVFVLDALRHIHEEKEDSTTEIRALTYLIHYKDYPHAKEWTRYIGGAGIGGTNVSEKSLGRTKWLNFSLSPGQVDRKRRAIYTHASQAPMLNYFFRYFCTRSELFGELDLSQVMEISQEYAAYYRHPEEEEAPEEEKPPELE